MSDAETGWSGFEVTVAGWTDPGRKRKENQDNFLVADLSHAAADGGVLLHPEDEGVGGAMARFRMGPLGLFAAVADGMGGAAGGRVASQLAIAWTYRELLRSWRTHPPRASSAFVSALGGAVRAANTHVHEQSRQNPEYSGMGSTLTVVGVLGNALSNAHVGDSRAYLVRSAHARRLTRDHSLVQHLVEAGAMTADEAAHSPQGSVLLQALGTSAEVDMDLTWHQVQPGDVVLLCSDGLFRVVTDDEIASAAAAIAEPADLCRGLVELANTRGGPDNVTVVAARVADGRPTDPTPDLVAVAPPAPPAG